MSVFFKPNQFTLSSLPAGSKYAGVGSRETPKDILAVMELIAMKLWKKHKLVLRSGAAEGADSAFQRGAERVKADMQIFLPWDNFNGQKADGKNIFYIKDKKILEQATQLVRRHHPNGSKLTDGPLALMVRNCFQVIGPALGDTSSFLICWTKDKADEVNIRTSAKSGGTGQSIRLGAYYGVKIVNLANPDSLTRWTNWLNI